MDGIIKISFLGDLCPINRVETSFLKGSFTQVYNNFIEELRESDYVIANLECPLTLSNSKIDKIGPNLKAQPDVIEGIKHGKINVLTLGITT